MLPIFAAEHALSLRRTHSLKGDVSGLALLRVILSVLILQDLILCATSFYQFSPTMAHISGTRRVECMMEMGMMILKRGPSLTEKDVDTGL